MTCIVGLVHEGVTYIGADSLGSNTYSKTVRKDKKVFHSKDTNDMIMGFTSSFRMGQILMYAKGLVDLRDEHEKIFDHEYFVTKFIPNLIEKFEEAGYGRNNNGEKRAGTFLLGYKDQLFKIEDDYQICSSILNYDATGCGEEYALGSLFSTQNLIHDPVKRIHMALRSATEFSCGVSGPYHIINTNNQEIITFDK